MIYQATLWIVLFYVHAHVDSRLAVVENRRLGNILGAGLNTVEVNNIFTTQAEPKKYKRGCAAGKVILKMEKINVQVTRKDPLIETLTEILRSHVSFI